VEKILKKLAIYSMKMKAMRKPNQSGMLSGVHVQVKRNDDAE